jgi:hypothetical protein
MSSLMSLMSDSRRLNEENTSVCIFLANSVGAKKFNPLDQAADSQLITFFMAFWKQLSSEKMENVLIALETLMLTTRLYSGSRLHR